MRILDLLPESSVDLHGKPMPQNELFRHMIRQMACQNNLSDEDVFLQSILEREAQVSTNVGHGVAIPHAMSPCVLRPGLAALMIPDGVQYGLAAQEPVRLIFLIAVPHDAAGIHMQVLSRLSSLLMHEDFRSALLQSKTPAAFCESIAKAEALLPDASGERAKDGQPFELLAVTACPTGIAHTYMAAQALQEAAHKQRYSIKVETNGAQGVQNRLTGEDIRNCRCIIVAADVKVEMTRFQGKPVLVASVSDGVRRADDLILAAASGQTPVYLPADRSVREDPSPPQSPFVLPAKGMGAKLTLLIQIFYRHLMSGITMMMPFITIGGLLIALAYLLDSANTGSPTFGAGNPFSSLLSRMGNLSIGTMLGILSGYIAMSIGDKPALVVGFIGGLISRDAGSGFIGALAAGFLAGGIVLIWQQVFSRLPNALAGTKNIVLCPLLSLISLGAVLIFVVNPPLVLANRSLLNFLHNLDSAGDVVIGAIVAGMMALDFGGPINKAAYLFATATLASGETHVMAAAMIGGMAPPLVIGLCITFFRRRFTKTERQSAVSCYVTGLCLITEGALPFALTDPLRVIPSCLFGSAVAGGLAMFFECGSLAPHGGIFVVGAMEHPLRFLIALAIGSVCGMLLLALLKKPLPAAESGLAQI